MMLNKPAHLNVYAFMRQLYNQFGDNEDKNEIVCSITQKKRKRTKRQATNGRNTATQTRTVTRSYVAKFRKH